MLQQLQLLLVVLGHRLIELAGRLFLVPMRTLMNNIGEIGRGASFGDGWLVLERLHSTALTGVLVGVAAFVGFLLLVRYLQSATRPRPNRSSPRLLANPDLPAADIFVTVATALIGLAVCWATN
jgi:hypothetical protein